MSNSAWGRFFGGVPSGSAPLGTPSVGGQGAAPGGGTLDPNSRAQNVANGVPYQLVPAYPPFVRIANDPAIVYFPRFRTITFNAAGAVAGADNTLTWIFSVPTIVIARTAAARTTDNSNLPVGRDSLDCFSSQMFRAGSSTDLIDAGGGGQNPAVLVTGSAIYGTARQPALIPGNGIFFDTGSLLSCRVLTNVNALQVDVTIWCIEEYGPARS